MAEFTDYFDGTKTGINGVTATGTTTGTVIDVSMRDTVGAVFTCSGHTAGNGVFSIDASNDGTNWVTGVAFADATATASTTYVTSKTLNSNTSAAVYIPFFPFKLMRIVLVVTTDGTYTATVEASG